MAHTMVVEKQDSTAVTNLHCCESGSTPTFVRLFDGLMVSLLVGLLVCSCCAVLLHMYCYNRGTLCYVRCIGVAGVCLEQFSQRGRKSVERGHADGMVGGMVGRTAPETRARRGERLACLQST